MNKKLIIIAGIALVVLLLAFYLWVPGSVPTGQQRSSSSHRLERRTTAPNLGLLRRPSVGDLKGKVEKLDCFVHVKCLPENNAHPAAFGKDVVGFSATGRNQLITDFLREGNVHQAVAMYVPDFSSAQVVLSTSKAMRSGGDSRPALQGSIDSIFSPRNSHSLLPPEMIHWMRMDGRQLLLSGKHQKV